MKLKMNSVNFTDVEAALLEVYDTVLRGASEIPRWVKNTIA